jgi:2-haloacid dehalogenase
MRAYADFTTCTRQALEFSCATEGVPLSPSQAEALLEAYLHLPAYPEVGNALDAVRVSGARVLAFSNGTEAVVRTVLSHAGLLDRFDEIVSVDPLRTFKPDPAVYAELLRCGGSPPGRTWLVSANSWDVIGAKHAGLKAAWVARSDGAVFDPWEYEPDAVAANLVALTERVLRAGL